MNAKELSEAPPTGTGLGGRGPCKNCAVNAGYRVSRLLNQTVISRRDWRVLTQGVRFKPKVEVSVAMTSSS